MDFRKFISEIQRRHVGRVAGVYAVVGWIVIQVVATVFPLLGVSELAAKVVVILIALGFPIAVAVAWAFDLTPSGLQRTEPLPDAGSMRAPDATYYGRALGFFGVGYAMIAQAYALLPAYGDYPAFEAASKGQAAAARALELNPNQAEAYAALGQIRQNFEWDFESAERSYKRAILFNNGYATAHQWRAEALLPQPIASLTGCSLPIRIIRSH
ncbi:MAG: hypothetical protein ACT4O1_13235 [Gemmatimonadota bacterium]